MSQDAVEQLFDRWQNDADFRAAVRENPRAAVEATGLELDADEWAAIEAVDFSLDDAQLQERLSKDGGAYC